MPAYRLTRLAEEYLLSIWGYIAQDHPDAADRVLDLIQIQCEQFAKSPGIGRTRDDLAAGLRSIVVGKGAWRSGFLIFYRKADFGVAVIRVLEGHRDIGEDFFSTD